MDKAPEYDDIAKGIQDEKAKELHKVATLLCAGLPSVNPLNQQLSQEHADMKLQDAQEEARKSGI